MKHDDKRELVESLLQQGLPRPEVARIAGIPDGSMSYVLAKWGLLDKQVRRNSHMSEGGRKRISESLTKRHAVGKMQHGESHWRYKRLKLRGELVPEGDVEEILKELSEQDLTIAEMAVECQVDPKTITNWLRKFNLQRGIRGGSRCSWYKGGWRKERGPDWLPLRKLVLERDGYKCVKCGMGQEEARERGHTLSIHHIVPWRDTQDNSIENLITLCQSCHMKEEWANGCWSNTD